MTDGPEHLRGELRLRLRSRSAAQRYRCEAPQPRTPRPRPGRPRQPSTRRLAVGGRRARQPDEPGRPPRTPLVVRRSRQRPQPRSGSADLARHPPTRRWSVRSTPPAARGEPHRRDPGAVWQPRRSHPVREPATRHRPGRRPATLSAVPPGRSAAPRPPWHRCTGPGRRVPRATTPRAETTPRIRRGPTVPPRQTCERGVYTAG
jgi:hypothetical protein